MKTTLLIILTFCLLSVTARSENPAWEGWATYYTVASCRAEGTSGVLMASNRPYDESTFTCALPFHPPIIRNRRTWGKSYRVTNLSNSKSIIVKHMDYGPGRKARARNVVIDLSPTAFKSLGAELKQGRIKVRVEPTGETQ